MDIHSFVYSAAALIIYGFWGFLFIFDPSSEVDALQPQIRGLSIPRYPTISELLFEQLTSIHYNCGCTPYSAPSELSFVC